VLSERLSPGSCNAYRCPSQNSSQCTRASEQGPLASSLFSELVLCCVLFSTGSTGQFLVLRDLHCFCTVLSRVHWPVLRSQSSCIAVYRSQQDPLASSRLSELLHCFCTILSRVHWPILDSQNSGIAVYCSQQGPLASSRCSVLLHCFSSCESSRMQFEQVRD
jgi:hypothetical protein